MRSLVRVGSEMSEIEEKSPSMDEQYKLLWMSEFYFLQAVNAYLKQMVKQF